MKRVVLGGGLRVESNEVPVKVKRLNDKAAIPAYQSAGAAGFDFHSTEEAVIMPGQTVLIGTGLAFSIPEEYEIQVRPRSGLSLKTGVRVVNSPGTCDSDFIGEVKIILQNTGTIPFTVNVGDRVAQGVLAPVFRAVFKEVEELEQTERGEGGFGSSGV